jgi:hypothetical protein
MIRTELLTIPIRHAANCSVIAEVNLFLSAVAVQVIAATQEDEFQGFLLRQAFGSTESTN